MINEVQARRYCCEDISLIENYDKAIADPTQTWSCHHRWETDRGLSHEELIFCCEYDYVPADRLIFLTPSEHAQLHGYHRSEATRKKMSEAARGEKNPMFGKRGKDNPMFGKHHTNAARQKIIEANRGNTNVRGKHWWNNSIKNVRAKECPDGFVAGKIKKTNS